MNENASSASGCFNRKKRRLIASFHLKQKPIYLKKIASYKAKPFIFKIHLLLLLSNNLMKYLFANRQLIKQTVPVQKAYE